MALTARRGFVISVRYKYYGIELVANDTHGSNLYTVFDRNTEASVTGFTVMSTKFKGL